jgi:hypothetical protein
MKTATFDINELPVGTFPRSKILKQYLDSDLIPLRFRGEIQVPFSDIAPIKEISDTLEQRLDECQSKGSIIIQDLLAIWNFYLLNKLGKAESSTQQIEFLKNLFEDFDYSILCDNLIDFNQTGGLKYKEGFERAAVITKPKRIAINFTVEKEGTYNPLSQEVTYTEERLRIKYIRIALSKIAKLSELEAKKASYCIDVDTEDSIVNFCYIPSTGYPALTCEGTYNPSTGIPFHTTTKKEAEQSYIRQGFSEEFAHRAVSQFIRQDESKGIHSVVLLCDREFGRFCIDTRNVYDAEFLNSVKRLITN